MLEIFRYQIRIQWKNSYRIEWTEIVLEHFFGFMIFDIYFFIFRCFFNVLEA